MSDYKCPHCEYYMWQGKEFYECDIQDKVSKLEQENAELKAENERLKEIETSIENYKRFYSETHAKLDELDCVRGYYNYKQTLQEIKAIVKKNISYQDTDSTTKAMTKILDLITKAEEE